MTMKTCCFCFNLKQGSNLSAAFVLVTRSIIIIILAVLLVRVHEVRKEWHKNLAYEKDKKLSKDSNSNSHNELRNLSVDEGVKIIDIYYGAAFGECELQVLVSVMLLVGVQKTIKGLFWPWMIIMGLEISLGVIGLILSRTNLSGGGYTYTLIALASLTLNTYGLICVILYYKSLSAQNTGYTVSMQTNQHGSKLEMQPLPGDLPHIQQRTQQI